MAADLAKLRNGGKDLDPAAVQPPVFHQIPDPGTKAFQSRLIDRPLLRCHGGGETGFRLVRQLGKDILLQSARQEGRNAHPQIFTVHAVLIAAEKNRIWGKIPRKNKIKDAPELADAVLHRSAGERETGIRLETPDSRSNLAAGVFDILCFIKNDKPESIAVQEGDIPAKERIGGDGDIHIPG